MEEGKAYIESGILELYVLGSLTDQEQHEVLAMAAKYPEIIEEIAAIEDAMEQYALAHAVPLSSTLEEKILGKITKAIEAPAKVAQVAPTVVKEVPVVPLYPEGYEAKVRTLRIALVACVVLLVGSGVALYSTRNQLGSAKQQIIALNLDKQKFTNTVNYMKQSQEDLQQIADMPNDPDWKTVQLAGTKMDPAAKMTVYWHTSGRHVMVDNSKMGLPQNDQAHQYQLWAMVDGKPVDLGVFDVNADTTHILLKMKEISSAQAFAVTLEKRGGSVNPTMDQLIAMGGVSI